MTGAELAALRRARGLSQTALGRLAGIGRHAVGYWETKPQVKRRAWAVRCMAEVLPLPPVHRRAQRASEPPNAWIEREVERQFAAFLLRHAARQAQRRVPCRAKTRKGKPCRNLSEPGRKRCKFHGGKSTGPRTPEGRARIAEAQRRRWARWRATRQAETAGAPEGPQAGI